VTQKFYRDHHSYSDADIGELIRLRDSNHSAGLITTEKDAVNLGARLASLGPVAVAQVTMEFVEPTDPLDAILRTITDRKGGREKISGQRK
jgi:tetraacyldisaccharide-1-P 4'-kinase